VTLTVGVAGAAKMSTVPDNGELHPAEVVTIKLYFPASSPEIVTVFPFPDAFDPPGILLSVHVTSSGKPVRDTLPVRSEQSG
jgi:hypothetical protein